MPGGNVGERRAGGWELTRQAEQSRTQANGGANGEQAPQRPRFYEDAVYAGELAFAAAQKAFAGEIIEA